MQSGEEVEVSELVRRTFQDSVAEHYSAAGVAEFLRFSTSEALKERLGENCQVFLAATDQRTCGMVEVRDGKHVSMLFVEPRIQRHGIGRKLLHRVIKFCREENPQLREVTVNASPNSIGAYSNFGFVEVGPEQEEKGLLFTPMKLMLD